MKKKTIVSLLLVLSMMLSLTACGNTAAPASSAAEPEASAQIASASERAPEETAAPEDPKPAEASETTEAADTEYATVEYPIAGDYSLTLTLAPPPYMSELLAGDPFESLPGVAQLIEDVGVNLEYTILDRVSYTDKSSLMIASGDFPDIFGAGFGSGYTHGSWELVEDEVAIDLTDLIPEHAPDFQRFMDENPDYTDATVVNGGRIVEVFNTEVPNAKSGLCVRKDWFEALDLEIPTTIDELTEVLTAIHNEYNTKLTLLVNRELESGLYTAFGFTCYNANGAIEFQLNENGDVVCSQACDQFIDYLDLLHQYFEAGLINDDFLSVSRDLGNHDTTYLEGHCGVFECGSDPLSPINWVGSPDPNYEIMAIQDLTLDGTPGSHVGGVTTRRDTEGYAISVSCEIPEIALEVLNYGFTEKGAQLVNFGIEGLTYEYDDDGVVQYTELLTNNPDGLTLNFAQSYYARVWGMPYEKYERSLELKYNSDAEREGAALWASTRDNDWVLPANLEFTTKEQDTLNTYLSDVFTHLSENMSKVILGDITVDDYRNVVDQAYDMGLQECIDIYEAALARR